MRIRRRRLRSALVLVGCLVGDVPFVGALDGEATSWLVALGSVEPTGSSALASAARLGAAILLLVLGSALHLWSKGCLEQNRRLTTAGPYRFTRNPFYLANLLIDAGLCSLIGRIWVALPYALVWWVAYRDTIAREESRLAELFPEAFARYAAAVPRLIPTGRSLPRSEVVGGFALDNPALARGAEYARILGVGLSAAALAVAGWLRAWGLAVFEPQHAVGLALALLVAVGWIVKLGLAAIFRAPRTVLLPIAPGSLARRLFVVAASFAVVAVAVALPGRVWVADLPLLGLALAGLDALAERRRRAEAGGMRTSD